MMAWLQHRLSAVLLGGSLLAGCQHPAPAATPAKLLSSPAQTACLKQIQSIIEKDTGEPVVLTAAAFAQSDLLSISPTPILDPQGRLAQGRERRMPENYRLSKTERGCYMLREASKQSTLLDTCQCEALTLR